MHTATRSAATSSRHKRIKTMHTGIFQGKVFEKLSRLALPCFIRFISVPRAASKRYLECRSEHCGCLSCLCVLLPLHKLLWKSTRDCSWALDQSSDTVKFQDMCKMLQHDIHPSGGKMLHHAQTRQFCRDVLLPRTNI